MAEIVALLLLVDVVEDDDGGDEVDHLAGGQQVQVGAAVASSVAVTAVRVRFLFLFFCRFCDVSVRQSRNRTLIEYRTKFLSGKKKLAELNRAFQALPIFNTTLMGFSWVSMVFNEFYWVLPLFF